MFLANHSVAQSKRQIIISGLQLYLNAGNTKSYPGSGTAFYDLSPNGFTNASLINGASFTQSQGGAIVLDATDDFIDTNQSLASEIFTIGAWFKTSAAGIKMVISKETNAGNPWNYRVWLNGGQIYCDISQVSTQASLTSPLTSYNNGNWYYVMFTRNDSNWYLYVNGVEVNNRVDPYTGSITNAQEVWIGRSAYLNGSYQFPGSIGEVMIYNRVLSATEVLWNFNMTRARYGV